MQKYDWQKRQERYFEKRNKIKIKDVFGALVVAAALYSCIVVFWFAFAPVDQLQAGGYYMTKDYKKIISNRIDVYSERIQELNKKENPTKEEQKTIANLILVYDELVYIYHNLC